MSMRLNCSQICLAENYIPSAPVKRERKTIVIVKRNPVTQASSVRAGNRQDGNARMLVDVPKGCIHGLGAACFTCQAPIRKREVALCQECRNIPDNAIKSGCEACAALVEYLDAKRKRAAMRMGADERQRREGLNYVDRSGLKTVYSSQKFVGLSEATAPIARRVLA